MFRLKIEQLYYFCSLAQTHSFNKTSEDFFISPQGVNKSMKALEDEFGVAFLASNKKGTHLTENGEFFLGKAQQIIDIYESARKQFEKDSNLQVEGEISIACQPRISSTFLFDQLGRFKKRYPDIKVKFSSWMTAEDVFDKVRSRSVDLGICILTEEDYRYLIENNPIPYTLLRKEELYVCALRDQPNLPDYFESMPADTIDYTYSSPFKPVPIPNYSEISSPEMQIQMIEFEKKLGNVFSLEYEKYFARHDRFEKIPYSPPIFRYFVMFHKPVAMLSLSEKLLIKILQEKNRLL